MAGVRGRGGAGEGQGGCRDGMTSELGPWKVTFVRSVMIAFLTMQYSWCQRRRTDHSCVLGGYGPWSACTAECMTIYARETDTGMLGKINAQ